MIAVLPWIVLAALGIVSTISMLVAERDYGAADSVADLDA